MAGARGRWRGRRHPRLARTHGSYERATPCGAHAPPTRMSRRRLVRRGLFIFRFLSSPSPNLILMIGPWGDINIEYWSSRTWPAPLRPHSEQRPDNEHLTKDWVGRAASLWEAGNNSRTQGRDDAKSGPCYGPCCASWSESQLLVHREFLAGQRWRRGA